MPGNDSDGDDRTAVQFPRTQICRAEGNDELVDIAPGPSIFVLFTEHLTLFFFLFTNLKLLFFVCHFFKLLCLFGYSCTDLLTVQKKYVTKKEMYSSSTKYRKVAQMSLNIVK